ncbi:hypothetical protein [Brevundimonas sp.]|uniref:hypothetical protein n=1 Tax=Brevundimonas sp. TaxID=1871086 RepID=UPI00391DFB01
MVRAMSSVLILSAVAALQTAAPSQQSTASDLTRMLNGAPPAANRAVPPSALSPTVAVPARPNGPARTTPIPSPPASTPSTAPIGPSNPAMPPRTQPLSSSGGPTSPATEASAPSGSPPSTRPTGAPATSSGTVSPSAPPVTAATGSVNSPTRASPAPASTTAAPGATTSPATPSTTTAPAGAAATTAGEIAPAAEPAEPPPPPVTVLTPAGIAALPFSVELPVGVSVTTGRPGPNFTVWTIRRGERSLVMIYAGPGSQFPIYSGQMIEAGGRTSIVAEEEGRRVALEHLFTRTAAPQEIHAWITSVEGEDRLLAERIAQTIDPR